MQSNELGSCFGRAFYFCKGLFLHSLPSTERITQCDCLSATALDSWFSVCWLWTGVLWSFTWTEASVACRTLLPWACHQISLSSCASFTGIGRDFKFRTYYKEITLFGKNSMLGSMDLRNKSNPIPDMESFWATTKPFSLWYRFWIPTVKILVLKCRENFVLFELCWLEGILLLQATKVETIWMSRV